MNNDHESVQDFAHSLNTCEIVTWSVNFSRWSNGFFFKDFEYTSPWILRNARSQRTFAQLRCMCKISFDQTGAHFTKAISATIQIRWKIRFTVIPFLGTESISRCHLTSVGNPIVKIRRSYDRLISTMGFLLLVKWYLNIESGPWLWYLQFLHMPR